MNMPDADFLFEFKKFLNQHVDRRLETMDRTAELEAKVEELKLEIKFYTKYYSELEDRLSELEDQIEAVDVHELVSRGFRIYVGSSDPNTVVNNMVEEK